MKKLVLSFLALVIVTGCLPEKTSGSDAVRVIIAGRTFKVPKGYFDGAAPTGKDTESVVLEYSLPGFEVLPPHPQERAARQKLIDEGRFRGMLLENAANRPPLSEMPLLVMRNKNYKKVDDNVYGLEKYTAPPQGVSAYKHDDTFLEKNEQGVIVSFLRCSPPGKDKVLGCGHTFVDKGLLYRIRWPIRELPNWEVQRDAAIKFIDSLEFKSSTGE